jgi:ribosomal protein S18 acetylase RimI-like enzyme
MHATLDDIGIRIAVITDLADCAELEKRCFPPLEAASPDSIARRIRTYPEGFLVAPRQGRIVGMLNSAATHKADLSDEAFKKMIGHDPDGSQRVIFSLAVSPDVQGKGIARRLIEVFVSQSRRLKKNKILLICKSDLIAFYSRFGFAHAGVSASRHGGAEWHEMVHNLGDGAG